MNINRLIAITENLMDKYDIEIRDTWSKFKGCDISHMYPRFSNNLEVKVKNIDGAEFNGGQIEWNKDYKGCMYSKPTIEISKDCRYKHVLVHEIVHFLQHLTEEENLKYITDGFKYMTQRIEIEAHFIQMKYIFEHEREVLSKFLLKNNSVVNNYIEDSKVMKITDENTSIILVNLIMRDIFKYDN